MKWKWNDFTCKDANDFTCKDAIPWNENGNENGMTSEGSTHIMFKNLTQNHKMHKLQKKGGEIHRYTCFK